jgi:hypothetical protein
MPSPAALPLEARQAAWDALWRRLLAEPPVDDDSPDSEADAGASDDEAAAKGNPRPGGGETEGRGFLERQHRES